MFCYSDIPSYSDKILGFLGYLYNEILLYMRMLFSTLTPMVACILAVESSPDMGVAITGRVGGTAVTLQIQWIHCLTNNVMSDK